MRMNNVTDDILISGLCNCEPNQKIYAAPKQKIEFERRGHYYVYLVLDGEVDVRRKKDGIIVLSKNHPCVLGLTSLFSDQYYHYISAVTSSEIIAIEKHVVIDFLTREELWQEAAKVLCRAAHFYYIKDNNTSDTSVYNIIKNHLEILWEYPEEKRLNISIFNFIMERSNISRSSLNNILKNLSVGGYITIKRGRLISLKKLPNEY